MSARLAFLSQRYRFSRRQYEQMIGAGIFGPEERLELLNGELIDMAPQKSRHATAVTLLSEALPALFGGTCTIRTQLPFSLDEHSEPEPDIAVVPGRPRDYRDAHPERALLIVEVAETTLAYDRTRKLRAYAQAGIAEYWILDLNGEALEVYRHPMGDTYEEQRVLEATDRVRPLMAAQEMSVVDILP